MERNTNPTPTVGQKVVLKKQTKLRYPKSPNKSSPRTLRMVHPPLQPGALLEKLLSFLRLLLWVAGFGV